CASTSEFLAFANVGEAIAATPAKLEKIRLLADYLRGLTREQLRIATPYFTGKAFAQSDPRTLQAGWAVIFRAMQAATKVSDEEFHRVASSHGDAGKTAFEVLDRRTTPQPFSISETGELFENLHRARGPIAKAELLRNRFSRLSAREGQYVVKILTGDLRIGLREGLVEEAIAKAFGVPLEQVREANMLLGDIGQTALLASRNELNRSTQQVEIFSRDLRRITGQFPEVVDQASNFQEELIIDGEIIAFEKSRALTFFDLQKRLGRRSNGADLFARAAADVPVAFVIFDLLWLNGRSLLKTPLHQRRRHLSSVQLPPHFQIATVMPAHSAAEIEQTFQQARQRLNEGLMIK